MTPWTAAQQASLSSTSPGVCSNACPLSQWCHPTILSSVVPFFSHLQSFPASGSFPVSQLFTSGGQSVGVSASASVLPMNIQDWFPLGWTGWISLLSKGLSRVFSSTTVIKVNPRVTSMWGRPVLYLLTFQWKGTLLPPSPWHTSETEQKATKGLSGTRALVCYHPSDQENTVMWSYVLFRSSAGIGGHVYTLNCVALPAFPVKEFWGLILPKAS